MTARLVRSPLGRSLSVAALPLVTGAWLAGAAVPAAAEDSSGGPRYSYFDAGYQWTDVNYAVKQEGGQHEGFRLNGSLGLARLGPVGIHVFGEFFDGDFSGISTTCAGNVTFSGDRQSQSIAGGLGASYGVSETTDLIVQGAYVDISEFEVPNSQCQPVSADDSGYLAEAIVRSELSENVEVEVGFRYADLSDSDISNNDVLLGLGYHVTDYLTVRARGVVFDDDVGIEIGARLYFGTFLGRDTLF